MTRLLLVLLSLHLSLFFLICFLIWCSPVGFNCLTASAEVAASLFQDLGDLFALPDWHRVNLVENSLAEARPPGEDEDGGEDQ